MRITKWQAGITRLFSERKFVIISHNKVRNIPISAPLQMISAAGGLFLACWGLYATGLYFNYDTILSDKDTAMEQVSDHNRVLSEHYTVMQRDLMRLATAMEGAQTEYDGLVLDHYDSEQLPEDSEALVERISYLEDRLMLLENYRQEFLESLGERTESEIKDLKKVLEITGIKVPDFKSMKNAETSTDGDTEEQKKAAHGAGEEQFNNQGGPYIRMPDELSTYQAPVVLDNVAELLVLRNLVETLPLASPMPGARTTSGYGTRTDPMTKRRAMHYGLDFAAPVGSKAMATASGKVTYAGRKGAYGKMVEIDHGNGIRTRYGHLRKILVNKGQEVTKGIEIGVQGNTGRSTGIHLHYEIRHNGKAVNPRKFLKAGKHVPERQG